MEGQPKIHFIEADTFPECEEKVNAWIEELPFLCAVLNVNVMPMMLSGKLIFLTVVMYTGKPAYMPSH